MEPSPVLGIRKSKLTAAVSQHLHIPNFSGDGDEDLLDWLDHFESSAIALEWDEDTKLKALPAYLIGTASKWYRCRIKTLTNELAPKSFEEIKRKMVSDLAPSGYRKSLIKKLNNKKQRPDQSAISYSYEIRDLCRRINPDMQEELVNSFIDRGLKSNIRTRLDLLTADNSTDFISKVTLAERSLLSNNDDLNDCDENIQFKETIASLAKQLHNITERLDCLTFQQDTKKKDNYMRQTKYEINQRNGFKSGKLVNNNYHARYTMPSQTITCYECLQPGHKRNECPNIVTKPKNIG